MDAKFTKGEWVIDAWETMLNVNADDDKTGICEIEVDGHKGSSGYEIKPTIEQKANAHLIASAPDMYNKLKEMSELLTMLDPHTHASIELDCVAYDIELLLGKARGE